MSATWRVNVARDRCMGTGTCVYTAPAVFALDDRATATVIGPVHADDDLVRTAVAECPTEALTLICDDC